MENVVKVNILLWLSFQYEDTAEDDHVSTVYESGEISCVDYFPVKC